jgi:murein tripeptide amidase MpaA
VAVAGTFLGIALVLVPARAQDSDPWKTRAERTGYRETGDYDEAIAYCRRLEGASPWVKLLYYGQSGQGRPLPMVVLSKDRAFTAAAARKAGKPIVLVQNGIHAGEIEGKDACLELMREIAVTHRMETLLDHATLLVLPIFSVDAHERRGPYNRINQNGPVEMGWRTTPIGLNLNRDYLKAETPEMKALIGHVFTRWWPDLLVDDHTTDGADYQYDLTYGIDHGPAVPRPLERWMDETFVGRVVPKLEAMGHVAAPYLGFKTWHDPRSGIELGSSPPRFSTGYANIQCRPAILVETHMLKPYKTRVRATYDLLVALLEEVNAHPQELRAAVASAEAEVIRRGREPDPARRAVVLRSQPSGKREAMPYRGVVARETWSDLAGARVPTYTGAPWDTMIPVFREQAATVTVIAPAGYLVPREWTIVPEKLRLHGVRFRRFAKAWADSVELQHVDAWSVDRLAEGHRPTVVSLVSLRKARRGFRPGDLWVPLDQRAGLVAMHLLEAQAPDGLMRWNAFDTVFEHKESAERYVMEPIARHMMQQDPALADSFRARLRADSAFARDPDERLDFFYRRSPWADPEQDVHPAARALRAPPESVLDK